MGMTEINVKSINKVFEQEKSRSELSGLFETSKEADLT